MTLKITHIIGLDTLGSENSNDDNKRFAAAVKAALEIEYPDAEIDVSLDEFSYTFVEVDDIADNVNGISNHVWNMADY